LRVHRSRRKWVAATVAVAVFATFTAVALGTGAFSFTTTPLATGSLDNPIQLNNDRIKLQTKDPIIVRVASVAFGPGGSSGWHHHPGFVVATVATGSLTYETSDCSQTTYGPGSVFIESGDEPALATSTGGETGYLTYVVPKADPAVFRIDDAAPACAAGTAAVSRDGH
jgi:quercetin dioxygenase-like cupin family protein